MNTKTLKRSLNCFIPWIETYHYVPALSAQTGKKVMCRVSAKEAKQRGEYYRISVLRYFNKAIATNIKKFQSNR